MYYTLPCLHHDRLNAEFCEVHNINTVITLLLTFVVVKFVNAHRVVTVGHFQEPKYDTAQNEI